MPRKEDIERFAQVLTSLGDEPAIRAARSESSEEGLPSGEEASAPAAEPELDDLGAGLDAEPGAEATGEAESLQDIFQSLSDLGGQETAGQAPGAEEPAADIEEPSGRAPAEPSSSEGLDFASLFGEEAAPEGIEDLAEPAAPPAAEPGAEESFALPEGDVEGLGSDLSALETLPEEPQETAEASDIAEPLESTAPGVEAEGAGLEDFGAFSMPGEPAAPSTEESPGTEPGAFDLPAMDDLSFAEPSAADESAFAAPSEPPESGAEVSSEPSLESSFEMPSEPSMPSAEEPSAGEAPSFDLDATTFGDLGGETEGPSAEMPGGELPSMEMPSEMPGPSEAVPGGEQAGAGLEGLGDLDLDEFSLPESAGQFGVPGFPSGEPQEEAPPPPPPPKAAERRGRAERRAAPVPPPPPEAEEATEALGEGPIELTPEQFTRLKSTLASLPRNLKIAVQDLVGEGMVSGPDLAALLGLLVRGASAQEIATLAGRISGKRIRIPAGYEKKSGLAFEEEQRTFGYAFRENFLPLVRVVALTVIAGALFGFLGYNYIYRPLYAWTNYKSGYAQIANDRFTLANERFARATSVWPLKQWYYRYAEAFAAKRNYPLAEGKYDQLLKSWPLDKKGILDYARLESTALADYEKADGLLTQYLNVHPKDYDALLASGDNDLAWADRDRAKYDAARLAYATLMQGYGLRDELLFRMLRYFIRTDKGDEVERLRRYYAARPEDKIDAAAFAEMGGYLVDHRRLDFVQEVLFRADKNQPNLPEVHYNLARYYRIVQDAADEKKALDATVEALDRTRATAPLTVRRLNMEIDTQTRLGEYFYATGRLIDAESHLQDATRRVETYQQQRIIDKGPLYGRPYAVLGDLAYYNEDNLGNAALLYQKAADNLYTSPLLTYKIGYVQYAQKDYKSALDTFAQAEDASAYPSPAQDVPPVSIGSMAAGGARGAASAPGTTTAAGAEAASGTSNAAASPGAAPSSGVTSVSPSLPSPGEPPQNLLFALGDTFYQRGDYFAAQASFLRLRDRLESRRASLGILHPEDRADDRSLLELIVKVDNNLGVTLARLADRSGDRRRRSEALVYLSAANEIASSLARSPDTVKRSEDRALASLNMQSILFPVRSSGLFIYSDLPKDFESLSW